MSFTSSPPTTTWAAQDIRLDPAIRNWVLLPITLVMLLVGILRHYAILLVSAPPPATPHAQLLLKQQSSLLLRSAAFRSNANLLHPARFRARKDSLLQKLIQLASAVATQPPPVDSNSGLNQPPAQAPPNPFDSSQMDGMMDSMKKQMIMMIPQTLIMGWINAFFSGFICVKLPFPLPIRFKQMLQRGIETPYMEITWVSSLSWYFLNLFGLNSVYRAILGDGNAADGSSALAMSNAPAPPGVPFGNLAPGGMAVLAPAEMKKMLEAEVENLKVLDHVYMGDAAPTIGLQGIEARILNMYQRHGR